MPNIMKCAAIFLPENGRQRIALSILTVVTDLGVLIQLDLWADVHEFHPPPADRLYVVYIIACRARIRLAVGL